MKKALLLACAVILAALAFMPMSALAQDEEELLPAIIIIGERHQPRVMLVLQRAPIGFKLPELTHDSLAAVAASVDEID
jgi:hypothetical protein